MIEKKACSVIEIKRIFLKLMKIINILFLLYGKILKSVQVKLRTRQEKLLSSILFHVILDCQYSKKRKEIKYISFIRKTKGHFFMIWYVIKSKINCMQIIRINNQYTAGHININQL